MEGEAQAFKDGIRFVILHDIRIGIIIAAQGRYQFQLPAEKILLSPDIPGSLFRIGLKAIKGLEIGPGEFILRFQPGSRRRHPGRKF